MGYFFVNSSKTLYQFNLLDEHEQAETLWNKGTHIAERFDNEHSIVLYQLDSFYIEVFYHREHNVIMRLRTFTSTEQLKPYLNQINLRELLK